MAAVMSGVLVALGGGLVPSTLLDDAGGVVHGALVFFNAEV
jgi:hypothetical protein